MKRTLLFLSILAALLGSLAAQELKLIPEPRQLERKTGSFPVSGATRIVISAAHAREDRLAAATIADEIESATGKRPAILTSAPAPAGPAIYLVRLGGGPIPGKLDLNNLPGDALFKEQGYILQADHARVVIAAHTAEGVFNGAQTLRQLILPQTAARAFAVPAVSIRDWPAMRWRGVHDDISRGPIPTPEYMQKQIRTLAEYKINLFSLYMEHVFDAQSQPLMAPREAAITPEQIKQLVEYAGRYHITLLPEQQAFGHLHHVLKSEVYSDLAETPHGHVLTPTRPATYDFIRAMYTDLAPLFPGPLFHIGSDETFELGQGQTRQRAAEVGLGRVYLEHLQQVYEIMKPYHKRLMFWADIAEKYPELLGILPKDMIAVPWEYDARADFTPKIKPFRDAGLDVFVSPGANNWNQVWPDFNAAFVNIRNFIRDGQSMGALGALNTIWDDDGDALFGMTWPALVFGAGCSWQHSSECSIERFTNNYDWAFYRNTDTTFRDAILDLNRTQALLHQARVGEPSNDIFWLDPFSQAGANVNAKLAPFMHDFRLAAEHALQAVLRSGAKARAHADTLEYLHLAALRMDVLGMKVQFAGEMYGYYLDALQNQPDRGRVRRDLNEISSMNARLEDLRDATTRVRALYADVWSRENRPYWLPNVLVRFDVMAELYQTKIWQVKQASVSFRDRVPLPPPEQLGFYAPVLPPAPPAAVPAPAAGAAGPTPPIAQPQPPKPPQE